MIPRMILAAAAVLLIAPWCAPAVEQEFLPRASEQQFPPPPPTGPPPPCKPGDLCCRAACRGFAFEFHGPPPQVVKRVEPDLSSIGRPYPCGIVILEIGINERGEVVSSCVLRGVRADFDRAAQAATRKWHWTVTSLDGKPIGLVMTTTVRAPNGDCGAR